MSTTTQLDTDLNDPPINVTPANQITDTQRIDYLAALLEHCPHAEVFHNGDKHSDEPLGWTIRVVGCDKSEVTAPTFRECIDAEILAAQAAG